MKASSLILALALTIASTASAQTMQAIRPIQLATPATQAAQIDTAAMEKQRMERENAKLREENAALKQRVHEMTTLGGSQVHAYCPNPEHQPQHRGRGIELQPGGLQLRGRLRLVPHHLPDLGHVRCQLHLRHGRTAVRPHRLSASVRA